MHRTGESSTRENPKRPAKAELSASTAGVFRFLRLQVAPFLASRSLPADGRVCSPAYIYIYIYSFENDDVLRYCTPNCLLCASSGFDGNNVVSTTSLPFRVTTSLTSSTHTHASFVSCLANVMIPKQNKKNTGGYRSVQEHAVVARRGRDPRAGPDQAPAASSQGRREGGEGQPCDRGRYRYLLPSCLGLMHEPCCCCTY